MKIFTAVDIKLLGDMDAKFGQSYYGSVAEQDQPVIFNLMKQANIMPGDKILAEEWADGYSKKGNPQTRLRKVKLGEPTPSGDSDWTAETNEPTEAPNEASSEAPSYEAGTNARWAIGLAYRAYQQVMGTPEAGSGEFPFDEVLLHAQELVGMFDVLKNPGYGKAKQAAKNLPREED